MQTTLTVNKRNAVVVRLGEKYILAGSAAKLQAVEAILRDSQGKKRKDAPQDDDGIKKKGKKAKA